MQISTSMQLLALLALALEASARYDSSYVYIRGRSPSSGQETTVCGNYQQYLLDKPIAQSPEEAEELSIEWLRDDADRRTLNECNGTLGSKAEQKAVVPSSYRLQKTDSCPPNHLNNITQEFTWQVESLRYDGLSSLLFLVRRGQEYIRVGGLPIKDQLFAEFRDGMLNESAAKNTSVFFLYESVFWDKINSLGTDVKLSFYRPWQMGFDPAMAVVFTIALFCVAVGGWWSGKVRADLAADEERRAATGKAVLDGLESGGEGSGGEGGEASSVVGSRPTSPEPSAAPFSWLSVVFFIFVIVGMLLLLYFFYQYFVWFIMVMYTVAGSVAIYECLSALLTAIFGPTGAKVRMSLSELWSAVTGREGRIPIRGARRHPLFRNILVALLAAAFCITWCVLRKHLFAFIMQDIIAIFFSINLIKSIRLPNLKFITVLLLALLFYDLFMVFITPTFTKNGCSVMVEVATGSAYCRGSSDSGAPSVGPVLPFHSDREQLPILISVPRLRDPMLPCYDTGVEPRLPATMLGLGDIILPGILVAFCFGADRLLGLRVSVYGITAVLAYGCGLVATFLALILSGTAQPALIYLVPFTLAATFITAACRRELGVLWTAKKRDESALAGVENPVQPTYNSIQSPS